MSTNSQQNIYAIFYKSDDDNLVKVDDFLKIIEGTLEKIQIYLNLYGQNIIDLIKKHFSVKVSFLDGDEENADMSQQHIIIDGTRRKVEMCLFVAVLHLITTTPIAFLLFSPLSPVTNEYLHVALIVFFVFFITILFFQLIMMPISFLTEPNIDNLSILSRLASQGSTLEDLPILKKFHMTLENNYLSDPILSKLIRSVEFERLSCLNSIRNIPTNIKLVDLPNQIKKAYGEIITQIQESAEKYEQNDKHIYTFIAEYSHGMILKP